MLRFKLSIGIALRNNITITLFLKYKSTLNKRNLLCPHIIVPIFFFYNYIQYVFQLFQSSIIKTIVILVFDKN